jgi:Herpesviridae UL52/UL70 DNA primase
MIRKWCKGDGTKPPTHNLMDGGRLWVDDEDEFLGTYLKDIQKGERLCVVEQKTETFKFFIDFDHKSETELSSDEIIKIVKNILKIVKNGRCFIARTPPKVHSSSGLIKTGLHLHWPSLLINKQKAMVLRNQILLEYPEYTEAIDQSVYLGSGLRLVWSYKKDGSAPYVPWAYVTEFGYQKELPSDPCMETLRLFSIRCPGEEEDEEDPVRIEPSSKLEEFIQTKIKGQERARVLSMKKLTGTCIQTDSKWCQRIGAEHKNNHVWFFIKGSTIRQKCHDEACKDFEGDVFVLPPSLRIF